MNFYNIRAFLCPIHSHNVSSTLFSFHVDGAELFCSVNACNEGQFLTIQTEPASRKTNEMLELSSLNVDDNTWNLNEHGNEVLAKGGKSLS